MEGWVGEVEELWVCEDFVGGGLVDEGWDDEGFVVRMRGFEWW